MPVGFIYAVLIISILVIAVVVISPHVTMSRGGEILAFLALFILPVLPGGLGYEQHTFVGRVSDRKSVPSEAE